MDWADRILAFGYRLWSSCSTYPRDAWGHGCTAGGDAHAGQYSAHSHAQATPTHTHTYSHSHSRPRPHRSRGSD